ncbi:MAG: lysine-sensitive aspartokinase 3 [Acidobacteriota bacterium]|nr:lysine-sensitive aspartokinase 3 [Acidobacteriota bacterium]
MESLKRIISARNLTFQPENDELFETVSEVLNPIVMKFGGTSVENEAAFTRVAEIVGSRVHQKSVVVVSAMSKMTDALLTAFETARKGDADAAFTTLEPHFERHVSVAENLLTNEQKTAFARELMQSREELQELLERTARRSLPIQLLKDMIVAYGEQLSSYLLALVCRAKGVNAVHKDARRLIVTDDEHGAASPIFEETNPLLEVELTPHLNAGEIPVMGGFIAATRNGETTVLERGGSDFTAAIVGAALNAAEIQIWTDVTGVLTTDPRIVPEARTLPVLSYEEAAELSYFGAKVLHPKTILPAVAKKIPVRVCNSREPDAAGTMILAETEETPNLIKSIAYKKGITILRITSARMLGAYGFMSMLFQTFERFRTVIDVVATSEVSVSLTIDNTDSLEQLVNELRRFGETEVESNNAVVCVVGDGLRSTPGVAARIFNTISDINVSLVSHGASSVNFTFVVKETDVFETVKRLHQEFFA